MKSAIVTGANGFVGSAVVRELLNNNVAVCAIIHNGNRSNLKSDPLLTIISSELSNFDEIKSLIDYGSYEVFFHFAWEGSAGPARADYSLQLHNAENSLNIIKLAKKLGCSRFVFAGTIMEHETILAAYEQGNKPGPNYIYGAGKIVAHLMAQSLAASIDIDLIWSEITNAYGPGETSPRMVNTTIRKCINGVSPEFTSGTQNYDFVYIDDLAKAFRLIGEKGKPFNRYLIGSSNARPLKEFLIEMQQSIAPNLDFIFGNVPFTGVNMPLDYFDTSKTQEDTGFKAEISFGEGCKRTMQWILNLEGDKNDSKI